MKALILSAIVISSAGCVMQQPLPDPVASTPQASFHPTLYVTPGTVGGVSKSTYTVTELKR